MTNGREHEQAKDGGEGEDSIEDVCLLSCDICGQEEIAEEVDEFWVTFTAPTAFEVLVCDDCADDSKNLERALQIFLETRAASRMLAS